MRQIRFDIVVQMCVYATLAETLDASIRPKLERIDRAGLADSDRLGYVSI